MAEVASLVVSSVGIAAEGLKLSRTITDFIERFHDANNEIRLIVSDIQATSEVLEQLKDTLDAENQAGLKWTSTKAWYQGTKTKISDCNNLFKEIKVILDTIENADQLDPDHGERLRTSDRWKWALSKQRKIGVLQGQLNLLKQDFIWRLQVSRYAQDERDRRIKQRLVER
jgi:hypothetical protein